MKDPRWCICFIHYGDPDLTARAVKSAIEHHPDTPLVVVDDCAPRPFHWDCDEVTVLRLGENSGYGTAVNAAFDWAHSRSMESIFVANNDVHLLEPISLLASSVDGLAAVAPVIVDTWAGPREQWSVQNAGSLVDKKTGASITLSRGQQLGECGSTTRVDFLCGAAAQYNLSVVKAIGGFRDDFFLFWEDVEWCNRATEEGYTLKVDVGVAVAHDSTATIGTFIDVNMYYRTRNGTWFALQTRNRSERFWYRMRFILILGPHKVLSAGRRLGPKGATWALRGVVDGLRDPRKVTNGPRPT